MSSWSDTFLRSVQFWMFYLGIGIPLLGVLLGGLCVLVKDRAGQEINQRANLALAKKTEIEAGWQKKIEADLRTQLDQTLRHAKELEEQQTTRVITPEQRSKFLELVEFSPKGKVSVYLTPGVDAGTVAYANQIHELVATAGYEVGPIAQTGPGKQIPKGIFMLVGDDRHPFAGAIQMAFSDIGISTTGLIDTAILGEEVRIEIGPKP